MQHNGTWKFYVSRNAQTAINPSPLLGPWAECLGRGKEVARQLLEREQFWKDGWLPLHDNVPAYGMLNLKQLLAWNWSVWPSIPPTCQIMHWQTLVSSRRWNWPYKEDISTALATYNTVTQPVKRVSLQEFLHGFQAV